MVTIDFLTEENIDSLLKLENECFSSPWTKAMFLGDLRNPNTCYFAAFDGGEVVGYAGMWLSVDEGQITNIAVSENYRRRKIAGNLIKHLCDECAKRGLSLITLEVRESNTAAVSLYEKSGFEKVGLRKNYYKNPKEDALLMTKLLS